MRTGGLARLFSVVRTVEELREAIIYAKNENIPWFVLGGGSNILVSSDGFNGLVIKNEIRGIEIEEDGDLAFVTVGAGGTWDDFVAAMVAKHFFGLENLSYIPGTVGAAPIQNIGAYGVEVKNTIAYVEVFDTEDESVKRISNKDCNFAYRDSIFKTVSGKKYIVTRVCFKLSKIKKFSLEYKELANVCATMSTESIDALFVRNAVIAIRKSKLPEVSELGSAGSFFKNPIVTEKELALLQSKYPEIPSYPEQDGFVKISAGYLIDKVAQMKGYRHNAVGTYDKQALVLVHFGGGTSEDIIALAESIQTIVKEKTGITLEMEVQKIGFPANSFV